MSPVKRCRRKKASTRAASNLEPTVDGSLLLLLLLCSIQGSDRAHTCGCPDHPTPPWDCSLGRRDGWMDGQRRISISSVTSPPTGSGWTWTGSEGISQRQAGRQPPTRAGANRGFPARGNQQSNPAAFSSGLQPAHLPLSASAHVQDLPVAACTPVDPPCVHRDAFPYRSFHSKTITHHLRCRL